MASWLRGVEPVALEGDSVDRDYSSELVTLPATSPGDALATFRIARSFRIETVAAEPIVMDPIAMTFDEHGRLYVVEMRGYSEHPEDRLGRIRMLEDRDRDGRYERATEYVTDLSWPTAVACYKGGVIVGHPPDITFYRDADDDGVAEQQSRWFTGFGRQNVQGMLNSFAWGLDGRLYGTSSSNGGTIRNLLTEARALPLGRRDFAIRFHPKIEMQALSGGGQHGLSFDRWGQRYVSSNSNHIQWVQLEDRYRSRNAYFVPRSVTRSIAADGPAAEVHRTSPVESWREIRTRLRVKGMVGGPVEGGGRAAGYFTGASGVTIYTGDAFPIEFRRQTHALVGDVGGNLVHHKIVEDDGLSKVARRVERQTEFLTSTDTWFRPVQFANGPDGCLYILDMYRQTIEHPLSLPPMIKRHLDLNKGRDRGRIYRVAPSAMTYTPRVLPGDADNSMALIEMLGHPNGWHRNTAQRLVMSNYFDQPSPHLIDQLTNYLKTTDSDQGFVRAAYCLSSLHGLTPDLLQQALGHPSWWVRQQGVRLSEPFLEDPQIVEALCGLVDDDDVRVRYQLAFTLGECPLSARIEPHLVELARTTQSRQFHDAILTSCHRRWKGMADLLLRHEQQLERESYFQLTEEILRQLSKSGGQLIPTLGQIWELDHPRKHRLAAVLLRGTGLRGNALTSFLRERHTALTAAGLPDGKLFVGELVQMAGSIASNAEHPLLTRIASLDDLQLAEFDSIESMLGLLLRAHQPEPVRQQAIETVASYPHRRAALVLLKAEGSLGPSARRRLYDLLCARTEWSAELLGAIENGTVLSSSVTAVHRQRLLEHRNRGIRIRAQQAFGLTEASREQVVKKFSSVISSSGDIEKGRAVFEKLCASCHRLGQTGHEVGPDLQPLRNRGAMFMLTNILDPNREVDDRYIGYTLVDQQGRTYSGLLAEQTEQSITIRLVEGKTVVISRDEIDELQATGKSLMPEGLEQDLNAQSLADLIAYLVAARGS